jgi:N-acetylglucosaminyl-diphospho-decaprenol L-rhamnosyltransferase
MILSVIIVNYRVKYFLELCLHSAQKALRGIDAEVIVVDNASGDDSVAYLRPLFPAVNFIVNTVNVGFARANNQALQQARGDYILFLNPDTILPEDIATRCISFLQSTPGIGGLCPRMIDGSGRFLKESRRGFPSPWVAACKLFGLTALFPHSRLFATYYLGHLPAGRSHPSPVLSGACLWISRAALTRVGPFDSDYFMYAEDIDLSYRLEQAGYVNYYFADATIVHFKGESTQKDIRHIRQFYKAMSQFRRKHFNSGLSRVFASGLEAAIWLRAGLGAIGRIGPRPSPSSAHAPSPGEAPSPGHAPSPVSPSAAAGLPQAVPHPRHTWLTGDPAAIERLLPLLATSKERKPASHPQAADEIIFCEGESFSFKDGIAALESMAQSASPATPYRRHRGRHRQAKFYATGSQSIVGSASRDGRGEIWVISSSHA